MVIPPPALKGIIEELRRIKSLRRFPESMRERVEIREILLHGILDEAIEALSVDLPSPPEPGLAVGALEGETFGHGQ